MNPEQWQSLIRTTLAIAVGPGSYLVTRGILTADQANQLAPALVPVVMAVGAIVIGKWGVNAHSPTAVAAAVANTPAVASAVIDTVNTDAVPGVKVVEDTPSAPPAVAMTKTGKVIPAAMTKTRS
jgi:hypothetical protein